MSAARRSASATNRAPGSVLAVSSIGIRALLSVVRAHAGRPAPGPAGAAAVSGGRDLDVELHAVRDDVVHGGALRRASDDLAQLLLRGVALDLEAHADAAEAVADLVGEPERAAHVHVAL